MALTVDTRWKEPYASETLNRKGFGVTTPGIYRGFIVEPGPGLSLKVKPDATGWSVAVLERDAYSLTARSHIEESVSVLAGAGAQYLVIEAYYAVQADSWASLKLIAQAALEPHHVVLAAVNITGGAVAVTPVMIDAGTRTAVARFDPTSNSGVTRALASALYWVKSLVDAAAVRLISPATKAAAIEFCNLAGEALRWTAGKGTQAETGADAGSDFELARYSDGGALLGVAMRIKRKTGAVEFESAEVTLAGNKAVHVGMLRWLVKPSGTQLAAWDRFRPDNGAGPATYPLPSNPDDGETISIRPGMTKFSLNKVTLGRNGKSIAGKNEDFDLTEDDYAYDFTWSAADNTWLVYRTAQLGRAA